MVRMLTVEEIGSYLAHMAVRDQDSGKDVVHFTSHSVHEPYDLEAAAVREHGVALLPLGVASEGNRPGHWTNGTKKPAK